MSNPRGVPSLDRSDLTAPLTKDPAKKHLRW